MSTETDPGLNAGIRASRLRVARSRGALSGAVLIILGAWAGIVPFIGPYFNFAFTPAPNNTWYWTADRGWLSVLPGAAAVLAGLMLLLGAHRVSLTFASWLGAAAGAWLVVGPIIAPRISLDPGTPDPASSPWVQTLESLFFYFAIGAAILFFASLALGRMSVHSVRDARIAQRRVEAAVAREEERRRFDEQDTAERDGEYAESEHGGLARHERGPDETQHFAPAANTETESPGNASTREEPPA
jgi:hypothetical protein